MDDLDALLADLQNTVSPETSLIGGSSTPGYGSLNGTRSHGTTSAASSYRPYENRSTTPLQSQSPTYQNREAIEEAATARSAGGGGGGGVVSSHPAGVGGGGGGNVVGHHQYNQSGAGSKMPSLNNNLSELDTLLQDLSNARYNSHAPERVPDYRSTNGGGKNSPMARSTSSLSAGTRPATVDSLLEELGGGISNGDYSQDDQQRQQQQPPRVKVTIEETDYQPEYNYSQSHSVPGSLNRRDHHQVHHVPIGFDPIVTSNGHTASNATKELDDLMASLSDFKINGSSGGNQHHHQQQQQHQQQPDSAYAKPNKAAATAPVKTSSSSSPSSASAVTAASSALPPAGAGSLYPSDSYDRRIHISETTRTTTHYPSAARYPAETNGLPSHQHQQSYVAKCHVTATRHQNQLDSMLGNLQADMSRQGVNTTQKGCCSACDKPIVGQVITALGKTWHPEHFTCTHCNQELGTRNFFEREGHPYCEPDYHNLFSPRCAYCNGPILDKCVTALDKTWHTEHFFCAQCGKQFGEDGFHERDGKPYCRDDYFEMFAPKCGGCNRAIMENYISALNAQWHPDCFVCRDCRQKFQGGSFFDHEGQPYCETHYHAKRGSLCAGCHKPITGRCITAMFRKFHPEHFVCAFCLKQLNKGTFKEQNDKPYCHGCFEKLFG